MEFLPYLLPRLQSFGDLSERANFLTMYSSIKGLLYFTYMDDKDRPISPDAWYQAFTAEYKQHANAGIYNALLKSLILVENGLSSISDNIVWGDKSPSYRCNIPLLKSYFSAARFIHIVRDVRDNTLSIKKGWNKNPLRSAQRWQDETLLTQQDGAKLGEDFMELRFEDLLDQPETQLRRLCAFCQLPFEASMMQLTETTEDVGSAKDTVGLLRDNVGNFRAELDDKTLHRIESIASGQMKSYGYPLQFDIHKTRRLNTVHEMALRYRDYFSIFMKECRARGVSKSFSLLLQNKSKR